MRRSRCHILSSLRRPALMAPAAVLLFFASTVTLLQAESIRAALNAGESAEPPLAWHRAAPYLPGEPLGIRGAGRSACGAEATEKEREAYAHAAHARARTRDAGSPKLPARDAAAAPRSVSLFCLNCSYLI